MSVAIRSQAASAQRELTAGCHHRGSGPRRRVFSAGMHVSDTVPRMSLLMSARTHACMIVSARVVHVRLHVWRACASAYININACMQACMHVYLSVCMYVCMCRGIRACRCICMHICTSVCVYICMCACVRAYVCVCACVLPCHIIQEAWANSHVPIGSSILDGVPLSIVSSFSIRKCPKITVVSGFLDAFSREFAYCT